MSRLLRVLRLLLGPGRWDAEALAKELECSQRTIHRHLQTLSMAGVPWYYDNERQSYQIRPGFKFPAVDTSPVAEPNELTQFRSAAAQWLVDGERLMRALRDVLSSLEESSR